MHDRTGRENPHLPQHTPDPQRRARALGDARAKYTWTQVATLPGVPVVKEVPFEDKPSIPWLLTTLSVVLPVVENAIAVKFAGRETDAAEHLTRLEGIRETMNRLREYHEDKPEGGLRGLFDDIVTGVGALLGTHAGTLTSHIETLQALIAESGLEPRATKDLQEFAALFIKLPLPAIATTFAEDATFARLRVAGPNAGMIKGIDRLPANFPVTDADYVKAMGVHDSLAAAAAEGRLYLLDYVDLASIATLTPAQKYLWCPLALFAVPPAGQTLQPVAIQCGQDPSKNPIFYRPHHKDWAWEMAKFVVQVADGNYHELYAHLARTHLVIEAFTVATHRALAPEHPLYLLLLAHTEGTLFINNAAAGTLIASGGPIDKIFAGTIDSVQLAAADDRLAFDFSARSLKADLAARRVDNPRALPDYPYRDDALLVWDALERWIRDYLGTYYRNDADVVGDTELAAFCAEVRGPGAVKGFAPIETLEALVQAVTMIVFTGSAQHAAVNFPQQTDMTWVPNVSGAAWAPGPNGRTDLNEANWLAMMPTVDLAMQQLNILWVLGGVHFRKLGDYLSADFPYKAWFLDPKITETGGPLDQFRKALREVQATIEKRNQSRAVAYPYLLPDQIPESINI